MRNLRSGQVVYGDTRKTEYSPRKKGQLNVDIRQVGAVPSRAGLTDMSQLVPDQAASPDTPYNRLLHIKVIDRSASGRRSTEGPRPINVTNDEDGDLPLTDPDANKTAVGFECQQSSVIASPEHQASAQIMNSF